MGRERGHFESAAANYYSNGATINMRVTSIYGDIRKIKIYIMKTRTELDIQLLNSQTLN